MNAFETSLKRPGEALLVPIVYRLAARLEQMELAEMLEDPSVAAYVIRNAQSLFGLPAVVNHYQLGIELESGGSKVARDVAGNPIGSTGVASLGRNTADFLAALVDTAARLVVELGERAGVIGVLTGPGTLSSLGEIPVSDLSEFYVEMARKYSEARVGAVLLAEAPGVAIETELLVGSTKELCNICRFFRMKSLLLAPSGNGLSGPVDSVLGGEELFPLDLLGSASNPELARWRARKGLVFTAGEVPEDLAPEDLISLIDTFNSFPGAGGERA